MRGGDTPAQDSGTTEDSGSAQKETPAEDSSSNEGGDVAEAAEDLEPVTLHFIFYGDKKSATDDVWAAIADYTRDKLNADFDVQFVAGDDYKQKLTVMAATGEAWDLNFDSDWTGYFQMAAKDAYMNLDELLPKYAPNLYATYEEKGMLDSMKNKGHIAVLPWTMTMNNRPFIQWRGDLAEAAGIEVDKDSINTIEDVDKLLYQLKEAYPDKYIVETAMVGDQMHGGWKVVDNDLGLFINLEDPKCTVTPAEDIPEYLEMAQYAEKWQKDGLIWKDILTDKLDHNSLINEGKLITKWGTHEFSHSNRAWVEESAYWDYTEVYPDIESGTIHAIGKDILIAEIQQNSNVTYRVYDYGRVGKDGKKRELHIEKALDVTKRVPVVKDNSCYPHIADCDYFTVDKLNLDGKVMAKMSGTVPAESFASILILDGEGSISDDTEKLDFGKGDSFFLSAGGGNYTLEGCCDALVTTIRS